MKYQIGDHCYYKESSGIIAAKVNDNDPEDQRRQGDRYYIDLISGPKRGNRFSVLGASLRLKKKSSNIDNIKTEKMQESSRIDQKAGT